ncbi:hypothetical protein [Terribacillus halophilus]|nr:hypothetical protein [Terribacillus halophilus]
MFPNNQEGDWDDYSEYGEEDEEYHSLPPFEFWSIVAYACDRYV